MRIDPRVILMLSVLLVSCDHDQNEEHDGITSDLPVSIEVPSDAFTFDIIQRTCALYVAVSSGSFKSPAAFDREINGSMVRWNMCDDGIMVACAKVPAANGDSIKVGIPWPYDPVAHF